MKDRCDPAPALFLMLAALAALSACSLSIPSPTTPAAGSLRDGSYEGGYFIFPVKVRVRLDIRAGRIENIELLQHFNGQGKAAEALLPRVVETQSLELEAVSGATHSSRTILKAIENALSKAKN